MREDFCDITIVLDESSSMCGLRSKTIKEFNSFINKQKEEPGYANVTLWMFHSEVRKEKNNLPIRDFPELTEDNYCPQLCTALLDGIGLAINDTGDRLSKLPEQDRPSKVLFVIITDGEENQSRKFNVDKIFNMIKHQKDKYNWCFVFIGANQDTIANACKIGIDPGHSFSYNSTKIGTAKMYNSLSNNTSRFRETGDVDFSNNLEDNVTNQKG